jgi:hypothetical protein
MKLQSKIKTTEQENMNEQMGWRRKKNYTKSTRAEICFNKILSVHFST